MNSFESSESGSLQDAECLRELSSVCGELYRHGWAENHAGNVSYRMHGDESVVFSQMPVRSVVQLDKMYSPLAGETFLVTSAGAPLRLAVEDVTEAAGVARVGDDAKHLEIIWGFGGRRQPTSELPAHLSMHEAVINEGGSERAVMHCHPTNLVAVTHAMNLNSASLSEALWRTNSEVILALPRGVQVLDWMVCGSPEIAAASAELVKNSNVIVWNYHGVLVAGETMGSCLEVVESVEKAAETILLLGGESGRIDKSGLRALCEHFDNPIPEILQDSERTNDEETHQ